MPSTNLGQVRDKITSIEWVSNSASQPQGTAGTVDTYVVKTECSPNGAGNFTVSNGQNGTNGINGADGLSIKSSIEITGQSTLLTWLNANTSVSHIVSIFGRASGASSYEILQPAFTLSGQPNTDPTISAISLFKTSGTELTASEYSSYSFTVVYYGTGDEIPQGYDLGQKYTLDALFADALTLYRSGTFADIVKKFPFCFGRKVNVNVTIFPWSVTNTASAFFYLDDGVFGYVTTPDAGTTWVYHFPQNGYNLGAQSTIGDAINAANTYYSGANADLDHYPFAYGTISSVPVYLFPNITGSSVTGFKVIYNGIDYYALNHIEYGTSNSIWDIYKADYIIDIGAYASLTYIYNRIVYLVNDYGVPESSRFIASTRGDRIQVISYYFNSTNRIIMFSCRGYLYRAVSTYDGSAWSSWTTNKSDDTFSGVNDL